MLRHKKAIVEIQRALKLRGKDSYQIAKKIMLREKFECKLVTEAIQYFITEHGQNFYHPALLSLACELVGGNPQSTKLIGASLVLITGAADIHDDIIDNSKIKGSTPTVLGKYGVDISLLVGNAFILKGCTLLHESCRMLPQYKGARIYNLVKQGFFGLIDAEAREAGLKGNWDLTPSEYFHIIEMKTSLAEAITHAGAILGNATLEKTENLRRLGKVLGLLNNIRNEFIDIYEKEELRNRIKNECLPLPIVYAFCDLQLKKKIIDILTKEKISDSDINRIVHFVNEAEDVQKLKNKLKTLVEEGVELLSKFEKSEAKNLLRKMLEVVTEDL